jgi:phosphoglycerate dehydrogenase-like enzyme
MQRILFPTMPAGYEDVARSAVGEGFITEFFPSAEGITEAQWQAADAIVGSSPPGAIVDHLTNCKIFVKAAVGFDEVDIARYGAMGIPVCNTPDYGTREVADHAIAMALTLAKSIAYHDENLRADPRGNWRPAHNPYGKRLSVCTFGVVGIGRIGTATARRAKAFDMDVVCYDPYQPNGVELALGIRRADTLEALMAQCDIVSIHAPLNSETRKLIGQSALAAAKPGMLLVNTARGPIIDLAALHDAMQNNTILAAALDVLPEEPANLQEPLLAAWHRGDTWLKHRLILTPHSAFYTPESMRDIRAFSARTAARYLREGRLENCVNKAFLKPRP